MSGALPVPGTDFRRALSAFVGGRRGAPSAGSLVRAYAARGTPAAGGPVREIHVARYDGPNAAVRGLADELSREAGDGVWGAYVHGSLGSGEEVAYSDLDALVILSDAAFASEVRLGRTAQRLRRARRWMTTHDPLQHHGWFVLSQADLAAYPEAVLPSALFAHARSLLPARGATLRLTPHTEPGAFRASFGRLADGVAGPLAQGWRPTHLYALKTLLSRFMLLPALYVQARDGVGVWKGDSFALAAPDFDADDWAPMDRASALRRAWHVALGPLDRLVLRPGTPDRLRRRWPVAIPADLAAGLDDELYAGMERLTRTMTARLDDRAPAAHLAASGRMHRPPAPSLVAG